MAKRIAEQEKEELKEMYEERLKREAKYNKIIKF